MLTPTDSPVSNDSSIIKFVHSKISPSAGTLSPASNTTTSPIVNSLALITLIFPSLNTLQVGAAKDFKASKDFSVLNSCTNPKIPFITTKQITLKKLL